MQLEEKISELPPETRKQLEEFVDFLYCRYCGGNRKAPLFLWAGGLKKLFGDTGITSLELEASLEKLNLSGFHGGGNIRVEAGEEK